MHNSAHILLVEDDEAIRTIIARNLTIRHHVVSIAVDAAHALALLRTRTFDLLILDINLPDQSGWDVLRIASREGCLQPVMTVGTDRASPFRTRPGHLAGSGQFIG